MDRRRLTALLGMLGSDYDGEVANAGRAADRLVKQSGTTWEDVVNPGMSQPSPAPPRAAPTSTNPINPMTGQPSGGGGILLLIIITAPLWLAAIGHVLFFGLFVTIILIKSIPSANLGYISGAVIGGFLLWRCGRVVVRECRAQAKLRAAERAASASYAQQGQAPAARSVRSKTNQSSRRRPSDWFISGK